MERCFTVAFTGHRSYCHQSDDQLRSLVDELYSSGALCFCVGMAEGFDMAAAECVIQLKKEHPEISLEVYPIPQFRKSFLAC